MLISSSVLIMMIQRRKRRGNLSAGGLPGGTPRSCISAFTCPPARRAAAMPHGITSLERKHTPPKGAKGADLGERVQLFAALGEVAPHAGIAHAAPPRTHARNILGEPPSHPGAQAGASAHSTPVRVRVEMM
eukprot:COSAG01_NODE_8061_length_2935_cov_31.857284_3_plen_132_part_00